MFLEIQVNIYVIYQESFLKNVQTVLTLHVSISMAEICTVTSFYKFAPFTRFRASNKSRLRE